ncbi:MAG: AbrB/MazE/SpoVT family DNA-binding domain-containing protein [Bacillota bacterium]|nr:AbrB/MazE/SpoVT family DNA-binding domain-containing protein [Bacillota bacterium]
MANYAKVSSKGQITLPASIRKYLNAEPGTTLEIVREGEGIYITAVKGDISALQSTVQVDETQDFKAIREKVMEGLASERAETD